MSTSNKLAYAPSTPIAITLDGLANQSRNLANRAGRQSAAVDNSANDFLDCLVTVVVPLAAGPQAPFDASTPGHLNPPQPYRVYLYIAGSEDGTLWPGQGAGNNDGVTGLDAAITLESPSSLRLLGIIDTPTPGKTYVSQPFGVANCFDDVLPRMWSLIVQNRSGVDFGTGASAQYSGVSIANY